MASKTIQRRVVDNNIDVIVTLTVDSKLKSNTCRFSSMPDIGTKSIINCCHFDHRPFRSSTSTFLETSTHIFFPCLCRTACV